MPGSTIADNDVTLLKAGTPTGNNKASGVLWGATPEVVSYVFSGADLSGFSATDLNDANFGVQISAKLNSGAAATANIDYVQITVTYVPTSGGPCCVMTMGIGVS